MCSISGSITNSCSLMFKMRKLRTLEIQKTHKMEFILEHCVHQSPIFSGMQYTSFRSIAKVNSRLDLCLLGTHCRAAETTWKHESSSSFPTSRASIITWYLWQKKHFITNLVGTFPQFYSFIHNNIRVSKVFFFFFFFFFEGVSGYLQLSS